jgi:hypothetical protein
MTSSVGPSSSGLPAPAFYAEKLALEGKVLAEICAMMRRLGYLPATAGDAWNEPTAKALDAFTSTETDSIRSRGRRGFKINRSASRSLLSRGSRDRPTIPENAR